MKWKKISEGLIRTSFKSNTSLSFRSKQNCTSLLMKKRSRRNMNLNQSLICALDLWRLWVDITEEKSMIDYMTYLNNKIWGLKQQKYIKAKILKRPIIQRFKNILSKCWEKEILGIDSFRMQKWEIFDNKTERKSKLQLKNSFDNKSKLTSPKSSMRIDFWKNICRY